MILLLEFVDKRRRGGEIYIGRLHKFLKDKVESVIPNELEPLPVHLKTFIDRSSHCYGLVDQSNPETVIADLSSSTRNYRAIKRLKSRGGRLVLVVQSDPPSNFSKSLMKKVVTLQAEKYMLKQADVLICNSDYTARLMEPICKPTARTIVARPGIQTNRIPEERDAEFFSGKQFRLLYVGEISRVKGLQYLIEGLAKTASDDITLDIVGGSSQEPFYYDQILKLIDQHSLEKRVKLHGFCDRAKLDHLYDISSTLVVPSLNEGYGMSVAEAFCHGLPVITSDVGGIPEVVDGSEAAILVEAGNPEALAREIDNLNDNRSRVSAMSTAATARANDLASWSDFEFVLEQDLLEAICKDYS